jgi:hypothetical protein
MVIIAAMNMAVGYLFIRCIADRHHLHIEMQFFSR